MYNMVEMRLVKVVIAAILLSLLIYYLPIDPELAVKIPVLIIVLGVCFIASWVGYIMITAPGPFSEKE